MSLEVDEGPRALVGTVDVSGVTAWSADELLEAIPVRPGTSFLAPAVFGGRDAIELRYLDAGFESVRVEPLVTVAEEGNQVDIHFAVTEGPRTLVDEIIVVGNDRVSLETILGAMLLAPGDPLGYSARLESQRQLNALGLFRRVTITSLGRVSDLRRDLLIELEEAPPTTIGYGVGLESGSRLRPTGPDGQAEERFEFAPRGFFEIGRSNLWGSNRSVNLFARVSLRSRDPDVAPWPTHRRSPTRAGATASMNTAYLPRFANRVFWVPRQNCW